MLLCDVESIGLGHCACDPLEEVQPGLLSLLCAPSRVGSGTGTAGAGAGVGAGVGTGVGAGGEVWPDRVDKEGPHDAEVVCGDAVRVVAGAEVK